MKHYNHRQELIWRAYRTLARLRKRAFYSTDSITDYCIAVRRTLHRAGFRAVPETPVKLYLWLKEHELI